MFIILFIYLLLIPLPLYALDDFRGTQNLKPESSGVNKILNIELVQDKDKSQIIIELSKPLEKLPVLMSTLETVTFDVESVYEEKEKRLTDISAQEKNEIISESSENNFINKVSWVKNPSITSFEVKRLHFSPVEFKKDSEQNLLIVEFPRKYFVKESTVLKPGIIKHFIRTEVERGPIVANALEIDLSNENISLKSILPNRNRIKGKEALSKLVKDEMAFAGINANYFDVKVGNPLGALITDGSWVTGSILNRAAIGFTENNDVLIDQVKLVGKVSIYRGFRKKFHSMFEIDGLNTPFGLYKKVGFFTSDFDSELSLPKGKEAVLVKEGCVKKIVSHSVEIPEDGYVLLSSDIYHFDDLKKKDCLKIEWESVPNWSNVVEAVSGGPYLIMNGEIYIDQDEQRFKFAKKDTFAPRSAIGVGKNGKLFLVAVDGRKYGYSVGATFQELAEILKKLNLREAINLDGGGSTTLVANGEVINTLSEHHERKISNALLIFYK